jgi:amidohydrolase
MANGTPIPGEELFERAQLLQEQMIRWRRTIHRYPELGFQEYKTAATVQNVLMNLGIESRSGIAKTGVVGQIFGREGPVVALRADMDALPIQETNGTDFDSTVPNITHACGHDAHTAMLLGAATILKELADQDQLPGSIRLIFQPSEEWQDAEGKSGGMLMVDEGALNGVQAVFGLHIDPGNPLGLVSTRSGPMLAAADTFKIVIKGAGGHAARPHETIDTIALAGLVINTIHHLVSRRLDPLEAGVVTIGTIHGGTVDNIIPDHLTMTGTLRSFSPEGRKTLFDELPKACQIVEPLGGAVEVTILPGYPPTINDEHATDVMKSAASSIVGKDRVLESPMFMGSEDFSFMAQTVPGCFLSVGTHDPAWGEDYCQLHQPNLRMDEKALPIGAAILAAASLEWMARHPAP